MRFNLDRVRPDVAALIKQGSDRVPPHGFTVVDKGLACVSVVRDTRRRVAPVVEERGSVLWYCVNGEQRVRRAICIEASLRDGRVHFDAAAEGVAACKTRFSKRWEHLNAADRALTYPAHIEPITVDITVNGDLGFGADLMSTEISNGEVKKVFVSEFETVLKTTTRGGYPMINIKQIIRAAVEAAKEIPVVGALPSFVASLYDQVQDERSEQRIAASLEHFEMIGVQALSEILKVRDQLKGNEQLFLGVSALAYQISIKYREQAGAPAEIPSIFAGPDSGAGHNPVQWINYALPVPEKVLFDHLYTLYGDHFEGLYAILRRNGWQVKGANEAERIDHFLKDSRAATSRSVPVYRELALANPDSMLFRIVVDFLGASVKSGA